MPVAAADARRVPLHLAKQRAAGVVELAVLLEHGPPFHEVGRRVDQQAFGLEPVTTRAARFLLIVLERSRRSRVHDEPHVRAIDAHPEGHGRDDDVGSLAEERILMAAALGVREAGVIGKRGMADLAQPHRKRIHFAARRAVHDARLAAMAREHVDELLFQRRARQRAINQVGAIERADELDRIVEAELRRDVAPHARRRGRRVGVQADAGEELTQPPELAILGPEVVPPLADAVRFVHRDEADVDGRQHRQKRV